MKIKVSLITVCVFITLISIGQNMEIREISTTTETVATTPESTAANQDDEIFTVVNEMPMYPGGSAAMEKFIQTNLVFPKTALEKNINSRCFIKITIKSDGSVYEPKVLKGVANCPECDVEALRVISIMPKWSPGKQSGKAVSVFYNLPINFSLKSK